MGCYIWYSEGGAWAVLQPAQAPSRCTKCNSPHINGQCTNYSPHINSQYTNHPISVLLCSFNVAVKGLKEINGRLHQSY